MSLGVDVDAAVDALRDGRRCRRCGWRSPARRPAASSINDAYNANPTSMRAALDALAAVDAERRVAVLGLMAELDDPAAGAPRRRRRTPRELGIELIAVGTDLYGVAPVDDDAVARRRPDRRRRRRARQGQPRRRARAAGRRRLRRAPVTLVPATAGVGRRRRQEAASAGHAAQVAPPRQADGDDGAEAEHPAGADGVDDRPEEQVADRDRPAEGHEPQRHHAGPLGVGEVLLEDRDQRRGGEEVGEAEHERDRERRPERAHERRSRRG